MLLLLVLGIALSLPIVQTKIAKHFTSQINTEYKTDISVDKVRISIFGGVKLKEVLILDHHKDTLIYSKVVTSNLIDSKKLLDGDLIFGDIRLDGVLFNLKTYKKEKETNIDHFINAFDTGKSSGKRFLLKSNNAYITNGHFILTDENRETTKQLDLTKFNTFISKFVLYGPDVSTRINTMSFLDYRGLFVANLSSDFSYTKKQIRIEKLKLKTKDSDIDADIFLNYKIQDFAQFTDKVQFDIRLRTSKIGSNDIRPFYDDLGKNLKFNIKTNAKGTLNNLNLTQLNLYGIHNTQLHGSILFKNIFGATNQKFFMNGRFTKLNSRYEDLVKLLPGILSKKLPVELKKLGSFNIVGNTQLTRKTIDANFSMVSGLGKLQSVLSMQQLDFIDQATYKGNVILDDFNLGELITRKDLGILSMNVDIEGVGFTEKYLNTLVKGNISKIYFKDYIYKNIAIDGAFKAPNYKGQISVNDPNLVMNFDGLLDLSKKDSKYDFHFKVENADLNNLKLVNDSLSIFKGVVDVQLSGNTIEDLQGNVFFKKTSYKNRKRSYDFDDFNISSTIDIDRTRTITVNSPDIIEGQIIGKFQFAQLRNLVNNSLGSLYTKFKPSKVNEGQFLKFNFTIYNKIIEAFYPEITIGPKTVLKGNIKSDIQEFKLNFDSPQITASKNTFDNLRIAIDNKNPLYNSFIELDSIKTKYYKIRDFSLINIKRKDTLYFRSEFKGGTKGKDKFNLNFFHTIDNNNENLVGINKSEIKYKDVLWYLNEKENKNNNQIVFDKLLRKFNFDNLILSYGKQEISLNGNIDEKRNRDFVLNFKDVDLSNITPADDNFAFNGNVNGAINFKQEDKAYKPTAGMKIDNLQINKVELGSLNFDIVGDENLKKFTLNSTLENKFIDSFTAFGTFEIVNNATMLDLKVKLNKFNLGILNPIGGEIITNIRGLVSGNATIGGNLKKPTINGRLFADKAGLKIPYLNVDYVLSDRSIIDIVDQKFLFRKNTISDTKFNTKGSLDGSLEHNNFADWRLNLSVNTPKLLALNTVDGEDVAYYGTAFMNGIATLKGPINELFIKVNAKSEKGTTIKIPISDAVDVSNNNFVHFLTPKEKYNTKKGITSRVIDYKGLELEFDLDITPDAEIEVILDKNSGHGMKGKGFGSLLLKINTLGKFNMWGDFQPYVGSYNFKYGLVDKKFDVRKGGSISWEGDPLKAQLNLEAVYKTVANPAVLLENSSFNTKVGVEVIIGIKGDLSSPEPNFNIEFPTVSNVLKSEIQYKLNDKDVRQTQALYLLSSGGFLSAEGVRQNDFSGSLFEAASSLLGGIIKSDNDKFEVGINYISADKRIGSETDGRVVATISSKVTERITINGKVGVPFGGITETAVIGSIEVQYRVNEDGSLNLRFFNRENDINYIGQGIGYTQGGGITYEVDFDSFKELANKIFKNKKLDTQKKSLDKYQDSSPAPEFIKFTKPKLPKKEAETNKEGRIPEED